jgi:hypothetical protein
MAAPKIAWLASLILYDTSNDGVTLLGAGPDTTNNNKLIRVLIRKQQIVQRINVNLHMLK